MILSSFCLLLYFRLCTLPFSWQVEDIMKLSSSNSSSNKRTSKITSRKTEGISGHQPSKSALNVVNENQPQKVAAGKTCMTHMLFSIGVGYIECQRINEGFVFGINFFNMVSCSACRFGNSEEIISATLPPKAKGEVIKLQLVYNFPSVYLDDSIGNEMNRSFIYYC